jgi:nucleotide-binding universal stress UspA family protein
MSAATTKPSLSTRFKNILFTTDLSPCSEAALPCARAIAKLYGSTIHIVHVVGPEPLIRPLGVPYPNVEDQNSVAQRGIDKLIQSSFLKDVPHTQTIARGVVWNVVSKSIADLNVDLIILGTHGYSGLKHLVLGSVAEQIFRRAACPVLTVGPQAQDGLAEGQLKTIMYATNFSPASRQALTYTLSLAHANRSKLILFHAVQYGESFVKVQLDTIVQIARYELTGLVPESLEVVVKCGPAADLILGIATDTNADLIVMGAHRGSLSHMPSAIAHKVVCHSRCPVLTVRS